jgi:hypothetical protein
MSAAPEPLNVGDLPLALSVKTTAHLANMSTDALYESIAAGTCPWPVLRVGRVIRIPRAAVFASLGIAEPTREQSA